MIHMKCHQVKVVFIILYHSYLYCYYYLYVRYFTGYLWFLSLHAHLPAPCNFPVAICFQSAMQDRYLCILKLVGVTDGKWLTWKKIGQKKSINQDCSYEVCNSLLYGSILPSTLYHGTQYHKGRPKILPSSLYVHTSLTVLIKSSDAFRTTKWFCQQYIICLR